MTTLKDRSYREPEHSHKDAVPYRFQPANPVKPGSGPYIMRSADADLITLLRDGCSCNLRAGRMAGKTSILNAAQDVLESEGHLCSGISLERYRHQSLLDAWKLAAEDILTGMGISQRDNPSSFTDCLSIESTTNTLFRILLDEDKRLHHERRFYVLVDETDSILRFPPDEVAALLLSLRSQIQRDFGHRVCWLFVSLRRLEWMIDSELTAGVTFNVAMDVSLDCFPNSIETWAQVSQLGFLNDDREELYPLLKRLLEVTGGHAQLTSAVLDELQRRSDRGTRREVYEQIEAKLLSGGPCCVDGHLGGIPQQLLSDPDRTTAQLEALRKILKEKTVPVADGALSFEFLHSIGLLKIEDRQYSIANPIYAYHLNENWFKDVLTSHQRSRDKPKPRSAFHSARSSSRIAMLATGGTVGMITADEKSTFQGANAQLREFVENRIDQRFAQVEWFPFMELDGINVTPNDWSSIACWIYENRDNFDGFVVTGGTDTLASTASGVAFMLGRTVEKPVVFTGAQTTITVAHGDALDNLSRSCFVAAHRDAPPEVQVQFGNQVFRAVRVEKSDDRLFQGFRSLGWPELAQVSEQLLVNRYALAGRGSDLTGIGFKPHVAPNIPVIFIVPGLRSALYQTMLKMDASPSIDGIIVHTPGAGNIPNYHDYNFRDLIREAVDREIPVLVTSQVPINPYTQPQYEMSRAVTDHGGILAGGMTFPAAHAKFAWVMGCVKHEATFSGQERMREIARRLHHNYQGEQPEGPIAGASAQDGELQ